MLGNIEENFHNFKILNDAIFKKKHLITLIVIKTFKDSRKSV